MQTKKQGPLWPLVILPACLFALSLSATRGWQDARPVADGDGGPHVARPHEQTAPTTPAPQAEKLSEPVPAVPDLHLTGEPPSGPDLNPPLRIINPRTPRVRLSGPGDRLAMRAPRPPLGAELPLPPVSAPPQRPLPPPRPTATSPPQGRPPEFTEPHALLDQLRRLAARLPAAEWAEQAIGQITQLCSASPPDPDAIESILGDLRASVTSAETTLGELSEPQWKSRLLRARYGLKRRLDIWELARGSGQAVESLAALPQFAGRQPNQPLRITIKPRTDQTPHVPTLMARLERYETGGLTSDAQAIADDKRTLRGSSDTVRRDLGDMVARHYRNANFRMAVSGQLLNRLLPVPEPIRAEVSDVIAGADVAGRSVTNSKLFVRLLPDSHKLRLGLEAHGTVLSRTSSTSGPATFYNEGRTQFKARKLVLIARNGMNVWPAVADANAQSELLDVETNLDGIPLIDSMARGVAVSQHEDNLPNAQWQIEQRVEANARQRLDAEGDERLAELKERFVDRYVRPLKELSLEPTPLELQTTAQRIVARVRLAGQRQLGAHTPRPRAPSDSHASFQVHESAINNAIEHLDLDGGRFTVAELYRRLNDTFGDETSPLPDDLPTGTEVAFAPRDAMHIRCADGRIEVRLVISELSSGRDRFHNFIVRAFYVPQFSGLEAQLVRDGVIQLQGRRRLGAKGQVVLRSVFTKVFSSNRPLQIVRAELAADPRLVGYEVTQFVIDDGWIGLAIAPERLHYPTTAAGVR